MSVRTKSAGLIQLSRSSLSFLAALATLVRCSSEAPGKGKVSSSLTVYQGPPCPASTVLRVAIQVSEDRDVTDPSEDRFETMPLVLETIPRIRAMVRDLAEILGRGTRDRSSSFVE